MFLAFVPHFTNMPGAAYLFINGLDEGIEGLLIRFANKMKLGEGTSLSQSASVLELFSDAFVLSVACVPSWVPLGRRMAIDKEETNK